ncbi:MAG: NADH-quinone oxidoreductase subunit J [Euryarchaeota archaeon]|nr:NADH-quinone oxidoreductase subunit J [Euryarchaeota archaeon]
MSASGSKRAGAPPVVPLKEDLKTLAVGLVFVLVFLSVVNINLVAFSQGKPDWVSVCKACPSHWTSGTGGMEDMGLLAADIFGKYVLPFEVLSIVLLVALIGAIVIARKEAS